MLAMKHLALWWISFVLDYFFCFEIIYYVTNIQCKSYLIGISSQSTGTPAALTKKNQSE